MKIHLAYFRFLTLAGTLSLAACDNPQDAEAIAALRGAIYLPDLPPHTECVLGKGAQPQPGNDRWQGYCRIAFEDDAKVRTSAGDTGRERAYTVRGSRVTFTDIRRRPNESYGLVELELSSDREILVQGKE